MKLEQRHQRPLVLPLPPMRSASFDGGPNNLYDLDNRYQEA
jgi:hypothetical protein